MGVNRRDFVKMGVAGTAQLGLASRLLGALAPKTTQVIDIHPHIISADTKRYPIAPVDGVRSDWSEARPIGYEEMVAAMDEAGVGKAAIVHSSTTYGYDSSYVADSVARNQKRFTGVFTIDTTAADAVEKIHYYAVERKLGGLRLFSHGAKSDPQSMWFTAPANLRALGAVQELGLPVCVSLRMPGLPQLKAMLELFPKTRFIVDHMIEPPLAEGAPYAGSQYLFDLARYQNLYLKVTTENIRAAHTGKATPESFFPQLVSRFGASRMAWGSNYPASQGSLKEVLELAQSTLAVLSEGDRSWIFARTAQSLYPMLAD